MQLWFIYNFPAVAFATTTPIQANVLYTGYYWPLQGTIDDILLNKPCFIH